MPVLRGVAVLLQVLALAFAVATSLAGLLITLHGSSTAWETLHFGSAGTETLPPRATPVPSHERLVVVTVATSASDSRSLLVSARQAGVDAVVLGRGVAMKWPDNLRAKLVIFREFLHTTQHTLDDNDIVVFADGYDTLTLGTSELGMVKSFRDAEQRSGRSILVNAEGPCYPGKTFPPPHNATARCDYFQEMYEVSEERKQTEGTGLQQYLRVNPNSGLYAGRAGLKRIDFELPVVSTTATCAVLTIA